MECLIWSFQKVEALPVSSSLDFWEYAELRLSFARNGLTKCPLSRLPSNLGKKGCLDLLAFWLWSSRNRLSDLRASNSAFWLLPLFFLFSFDLSCIFRRLLKNKAFSSFLQHINSLLEFLVKKRKRKEKCKKMIELLLDFVNLFSKHLFALFHFVRIDYRTKMGKAFECLNVIVVVEQTFDKISKIRATKELLAIRKHEREREREWEN